MVAVHTEFVCNINFFLLNLRFAEMPQMGVYCCHHQKPFLVVLILLGLGAFACSGATSDSARKGLGLIRPSASASQQIIAVEGLIARLLGPKLLPSFDLQLFPAGNTEQQNPDDNTVTDFFELSSTTQDTGQAPPPKIHKGSHHILLLPFPPTLPSDLWLKPHRCSLCIKGTPDSNKGHKRGSSGFWPSLVSEILLQCLCVLGRRWNGRQPGTSVYTHCVVDLFTVLNCNARPCQSHFQRSVRRC